MDVITRFGWELNQQPCDYGRRKNDAPNRSTTLPASWLTKKRKLEGKDYTKNQWRSEKF